MEKDREENNVKCVPYQDIFLNSTPINSIQGKMFDGKAEVILLEPEAIKNRHETDHAVANCRVIELSHSNSKMTLGQQFGEMAEYSKLNLQRNTTDYENMDMLRKLPPDTVVIRQETRRNKENSDYKELKETNNSGNNSTSGFAATKAKRISRVVRNKTRETIEVRRNPMRISKKNVDKDFSRPKQRLLANKKQEIYSSYGSGKCTRSSATPYMNTRSVTRKMYTVGATYQAPTKRDETEWKEWPVHGMHERPVYHPQAGLAVEYLGRYFTSLDGLSYCEIIDEPEIEIVAVDPHRDRRFSSVEKIPKEKMKIKNKRPQNDKDAWNYFSMKNKSFETCMHGSLHCVLGYCSEIMTPVYKQAVEEKTTKLTVSAASTSSSIKELTKEKTNFKDNITCSSKSVGKISGEAKLLEAYAIAMAQSAQNKNIMNNANKISSTFASSSAKYVPEAERLIMKNDGAKSIRSNYESGKCMNREMIQMDLKRILRGPPNNSLILLRSSAAKGSDENCTTTAKDAINSIKLENRPSGDETLMEMSSIYKKFVFADEPILNREEPRHNLYSLKRHATNAQEYTTKVFVDNQLENKKIVQVTKEKNESRNVEGIKASRESDGDVPTTSSGKTRAWYTETSEIAKILSEYNRGTLKKSTIQNQIYCSRANLMNSSIKSLPKNLWQTNTKVEGNRSFVTDVNTALDFSQEKWKFHGAPEKNKNGQVADSTQIAWNDSSTSLENRQVSLKDWQMNLNALNYVREKSIESRKNITEQQEIVMIDTKSNEMKSECTNEMKSSKTESLQELLENTAILYCAANGVHQDDLSNYIDTLDSKQSIQWLENWNNTIV